MKQLSIKSPAFLYLEQSFGQWLHSLGYAPKTVYQLPIHVREFFFYLESQGHTQIKDIDIPVIRAYYTYLSERANTRRSGALSNNYLNGHLNAIDKLLDYLRNKGKLILPATNIKREEKLAQPIHPLTPKQITQLYEATQQYEPQQPVLAKRDRAMLAVYYDGGLRRNEGVQLDVKDVNMDTRVLHVRYGKNNKQRLVPFHTHTAKYLSEYRHTVRIRLLKHHTSEQAFFLNKHGGRLRAIDMRRRLKFIQQHCTDTELRTKKLYIHLLRHSIATHLLQNGMPIENIARFLGHRSLESTQLYTHLASVLEPDAL